MIYTIGRQFGSGGREIGYQLSQRLGIPFYDRELVELASRKSGICEELFENNEEKTTTSLLYSMVMGTYTYGGMMAAPATMPIGNRIFLAQFETIQSLAAQGPCVIVGRCADYALRERTDCIHVFIWADLPNRVKRICERNQVDEEKAREMIAKTDKGRASYYNFYTNKKWGATESYHLALDSGRVGVEGAVQIIQKFGELAR